MMATLSSFLRRPIGGSSDRAAVKPAGIESFPSRLPSIDGWRALSIFLVLGDHSVYTYDFPRQASSFFGTVFDGNLGVRFFFVISGFLITYLLLKEHGQAGALSVRNFYTRRALRILPVYFMYLAVVFVLQLFTPLRQFGSAWAANLTFTTNFAPLVWTTGHLWSLAVEEQFYLLWPILLSLAGLQNTRRIVHLLLIPILLAPMCRVLSQITVPVTWVSPLFQRYSSFNYFDSVALGCMSAVLLLRHHNKARMILARFPGTILLAGAAFIVVPQMLVKCFVAAWLTVPLGSTLQAIGFSMLLLLSIFSPQFFKPLNWALVRQIGVLSYSIYIWQMLFCINPRAYGLPHVWFLSFYGWWWAALSVAICSYYCLERPLMSLRARLRSASNQPIRSGAEQSE